jgi:hypothetical protein
MSRSPLLDLKYTYHEHMALASRTYWGGNKRNSNQNKSKDSSRSYKSNGLRVRSYYNCNNTSRFIENCPFDKREEHGGKFVLKNKYNILHNKNFIRRNPKRI